MIGGVDSTLSNQFQLSSILTQVEYIKHYLIVKIDITNSIVGVLCNVIFSEYYTKPQYSNVILKFW